MPGRTLTRSRRTAAWHTSGWPSSGSGHQQARSRPASSLRAQAIAEVGTALAEGNITAALDGIEKVREPAAQARRVLKAAARGKKLRTAKGSGTGVRPGALRDLVQAHLYDNPGEEFTPHQISKALTRSSGAVANALDRLIQLGIAVQTSEKPRRFQFSPDAAARPAPADAATGTVTAPEPGDGTTAEITADAT
jgi:urease beta subunit